MDQLESEMFQEKTQYRSTSVVLIKSPVIRI